MIDFHSHVLPGMDDGAKDAEMAVAMVDESVRQGVTTIVCTPHYYSKRSPRSFVEKRKAAFQRLMERGASGIEFRLAAEVFFTEDTSVSFDDLAILAIENTRYILLELPFQKRYTERLFEKLDEFISETGLTPIIAHVERYPALLAKPSIVTRLVDMGCLIQVNAVAFEVKGVKSFAECLLRKGMIHVVGSDMHNTDARPQSMQAYEAAVERLGMQAAAKKIDDIGAAILRDDEISVSSKPIGKFFGKYF